MASPKNLRAEIKQMLGPIPQELALARQQVRREIRAEFCRAEDGEPISLTAIAERVHARLRPGVIIKLGYVKNVVKNMARAGYGRRA